MSEGNRDQFASLMDENVQHLKLPYKKAHSRIGKITAPEESGSRDVFARPEIKNSSLKDGAVVAYASKRSVPRKDLVKETSLKKVKTEEDDTFSSFLNQVATEDAHQIEIKARRFNNSVNKDKPANYSNYKNFSKYCSFWLKGECNRGKTCPYIHAEPPKIRRRNPKYDIKNRYLGIQDPDQKLTLRGLRKARETYKKMGYLENEVLVYFVEDCEVEGVMRRVKKVLGEDVGYEFNPDKMGLRLIFRDREKAEWCIKIFKRNFVVNGKSLTFQWIKDKKPKMKRNMRGQFIDEKGEVIEKKEEEEGKSQKKKGGKAQEKNGGEEAEFLKTQ